mgnify:CR=1 FL=1
MRKFLCSGLMALCAQMSFGQNGNHQPYANYWFPNDLLTWSPASDPSSAFNRSAVPLASRFTDVDAACIANRPMGLKLASLAITNANTSGNPSQGYDHAGEYSFTYWQYLDYFVMWGGSAGEGLILAPNATWIDAGHRNGVKVMGTVFLPPVSYGGQLQWLEHLLQTDVNGNYIIADKLIDIADYYGFDGWFINQETGGANAALGEKMIAFMKYFQQHKSPGQEIMWYDAMLPTGPVTWQRELNDANKRMFQDGTDLVSQTMFLDFAWNATKLANSKTKAATLNRSALDLLAGIDVQANGYNTSINWNAIFPTVANPNTSVGLYVPSWTFHSSPDKNDIPLFYQRESRFWMGATNNPCTPPSSGWPGFAKYYNEKSVIQQFPFITRFNAGHGTDGFWIGGTQLSAKAWHNQSAQDIMPTWRWNRSGSGTLLDVALDFNTAYEGGNSIKVSGNLNTGNTTTLKLYNTKLLLSNANAYLRIKYKKPAAGASNMKLALAFADAPQTLVYLNTDPAGNGWTTDSLPLSAYLNKTISTIGLQFEGNDPNYEINIGELAVFNQTAATVPAAVTGLALQEYAACDLAEVEVKFNPSTATDIWYYDIYRVLGNNQLVWLGRTPNNAFYVKNIQRDGSEANATIRVVAVNTSGVASTPVNQSFAWPPNAGAGTEYYLSLNGTDEYVDAGNLTLSGNAMSISAWVKPESFKTSSPFISSIAGIENGDGNTAMLRFGDASVPKDKVQFVLSINGQAKKLTSNSAVTVAQWHNITGTYDGATMRIFIDGVEDASMSVTGTYGASGTFFLGRNSSNDRCLHGSLDGVALWSKALSAAEIQAGVCAVPSGTNGLLANWTFDDCPAVIIDKGPNQYLGQPVGLDAANWIAGTGCGTVNLREQHKLSDIAVHPNPVSQGQALTITAKEAQPMTIEVLDVTGKLRFKMQSATKTIIVPTQDLSAGVYLLQVSAGLKGTYQSKFVVK